MIDEADRLDAALDSRPEVVGPDLGPLLEVAAEVSRFLDARLLAPHERHLIYMRAMSAAARQARFARVRRALTDRRLPAIVGGAAVTVAAAAAIAVALTRDRRTHAPSPVAV